MKRTIIPILRIAIIGALVCASVAWHKKAPVVCTGKCATGAVYTLTVLK